ncbi:CE1759 family FMN reductase [Georgenia sp. Z1491]|uniref:CE1759 family FMN reductase n=1 Tax=Georgenia sp. Z1491 TaxID=3416707 RepID=UPI003CF46D39
MSEGFDLDLTGDAFDDRPGVPEGAGGTERRIVTVSAGTSDPSTTRMLADRLGRAAVTGLSQRGVRATLMTLDLRTIAHDLLDTMLTGVRSTAVEEAMDAVRGADGLVVTTPVYSGSYSGLLKMFLDVLDRGSIDGTPVLLSATGGTPRHSLAIDYALRPLVAYLRGSAMPTAVYAATDDWAAGAGEPGGPDLPGRIVRAGEELAHAVAGSAPRQAKDEFDDVPDFSSMLSALR